MDADSYNSMEEEDAFMPDFIKRGDKVNKLSETAEKNAMEITQSFRLRTQLNENLDPYNRAGVSMASVSPSSISFSHFFVKNKYKGERAEVFGVLRQLLSSKGYKQICKISDKEQQQIMVVRVIQKVQTQHNLFIIEDEYAQAKILVRNGFIWIGLICAVKVKWVDGSYRLEQVIDLSSPITGVTARLSADLSAYRILFVKGSFRPKFGKEDIGIRIIIDQLRVLRKKNVTISCIVLMGPILPKSNNLVENFKIERTFEEEYEHIIQVFRTELNKMNDEIDLYIIPSVDDVISLYPIPQPSYEPTEERVGIKHLSNPASLTVATRKSRCKIDLINYDILKYIQTFKGGRAEKDMRQNLIQSYLKQPFLLSNTIISEEPFDQINLEALFNKGDYGDVVVFSSQQKCPFVNRVGNRIVLNIGSLGVDYHYSGNYMVVGSIFDGEGVASDRIKIQTILCE